MIAYPLIYSLEPEHEKHSHRIASDNPKSEYQCSCSDDHEPSCRNRCEKSYDPKEKEKNSKKYPHPKWQKHSTLIPRMDTDSIKYLSKLFFIGLLLCSPLIHKHEYKKNPLENKGFSFFTYYFRYLSRVFGISSLVFCMSRLSKIALFAIQTSFIVAWKLPCLSKNGYCERSGIIFKFCLLW